jgi:hypothetical protein
VNRQVSIVPSSRQPIEYIPDLFPHGLGNLTHPGPKHSLIHDSELKDQGDGRTPEAILYVGVDQDSAREPQGLKLCGEGDHQDRG